MLGGKSPDTQAMFKRSRASWAGSTSTAASGRVEDGVLVGRKRHPMVPGIREERSWLRTEEGILAKSLSEIDMQSRRRQTAASSFIPPWKRIQPSPGPLKCKILAGLLQGNRKKFNTVPYDVALPSKNRSKPHGEWNKGRDTKGPASRSPMNWRANSSTTRPTVLTRG